MGAHEQLRRLDDVEIPPTMAAVLLTGHGGYDRLEYRTDVATPVPAADEVLIRIRAAGVNNTDINTRIGWYSKSIDEGTNAGGGGFEELDEADASWSGTPLSFPRIQGADACGLIVAVGAGVDPARLGERVIVHSMHPVADDPSPVACLTFGSEIDGGFAQYVAVSADIAYTVDCDWTDAELASVPCAWGTAEGMLERASVGAERVLVTGASGGVGSAAVQLARRRGAAVTAIAGRAKHDEVRALGAERVLDRAVPLLDQVPRDSFDVALDVVAGAGFGDLLEALTPGGRYATVGAIAGPIVDLDVRTLYLKDLTLFGSTYQPPSVFENLVTHIEAGGLRPVVAATFPLSEIVQAQQAFLDKKFVGKLVLIPPPD